VVRAGGSAVLSRILLGLVTVALGTVAAVEATTLWVGNDTASPVERFDSVTQASLGFFGQTGATGSALDGAGHVYTVAPSFGHNVIQKYDAAQNVVASFIAAINGQFIDDMTYGGGRHPLGQHLRRRCVPH
jgi:hypothetical protein